MVELSIIVPFYNEEENVRLVFDQLEPALAGLGKSYELVFVNDGSRDGTARMLDELAQSHAQVKVVHLIRNFGQTAAMMAGIDHADGEIIIGMDGDGQNDPADFPHLLAKLDEGYDVVSGWRQGRKDALLRRRLPSWFANRLISFVSGVRLHDYGCSLKAYRRDVIKNVRLYGEMHRFIPIYTAWQGGRIAELPVRHNPRLHGRSKYGLGRIVRVVLDLLLVSFLDRYLTRPIHAFGTVGLACLGLGFLAGVWAIGLKVVYGTSFILTPLPLLVVSLGTMGIQFILMGILAELVMRTYYESQGKRTYIVRESHESRESRDFPGAVRS